MGSETWLLAAQEEHKVYVKFWSEYSKQRRRKQQDYEKDAERRAYQFVFFILSTEYHQGDHIKDGKGRYGRERGTNTERVWKPEA